MHSNNCNTNTNLHQRGVAKNLTHLLIPYLTGDEIILVVVIAAVGVTVVWDLTVPLAAAVV